MMTGTNQQHLPAHDPSGVVRAFPRASVPSRPVPPGAGTRSLHGVLLPEMSLQLVGLDPEPHVAALLVSPECHHAINADMK